MIKKLLYSILNFKKRLLSQAKKKLLYFILKTIIKWIIHHKPHI